VNNFEKRKARTSKRIEDWEKYDLTFKQYRALYRKWRYLRKKGSNITLEFLIENRDSEQFAKKIKVDPLQARLNKYGLSLERYLDLLKEQNNRCAICETKPRSFDGTLVIDHCHKTSKVRGLLCNQCNSGLGFFKDDKGSLLNAVQYLIKSKN
jgi:Recombination endonuclease VII